MNPRRYSQIERALQILDKSGTVELLKEDQYLLFLFKKAERVVAALYVVTGLFPDVEPLKWGIRESGTLLIKHLMSLKERATVHSKEFLSETFAELARLSSLLDLAYVADLLSPMNFSVLTKEFETVIAIVEGKWRISGVPSSPPFFEESFFGIPKDIFSDAKERKNEMPLPFSAGVEQREEDGGKLHSFGEFERLQRGQLKDIYQGHLNVRDSVLNRRSSAQAPASRATSVKKSSPRPLSDDVREGRTQSILRVLSEKNSAVIKDFSSIIKGCSEKTIQRLLIALVRDGVLKREGDRRWSRYSAVKPTSLSI